MLDWISYTSHNHLKTICYHGVWYVDCMTEKSHTGFGYVAEMPEGENFSTIRTKMDLLQPDNFPKDNHEYWRLASLAEHRKHGNGYGYSPGETKRIVELAEKYSLIEGSLDDILINGGFERYHEQYARKVGSGYFYVCVGDDQDNRYLKLTYDPPRANRWHNILYMSEYNLNYSGKLIIYNFFPNNMKRPLVTFAKVAVEMANLREANGPRRYHRPSL